MKSVLAAATALLLAHCGASPLANLEERQSCPNIHVFGARETTAPAGYGTAGVVVNLILNAYPGATSEAISYPACGGQSSCGGASYASSANQGVAAVASAVNSFNSRCPNTQLVLVGYSQGAQISDDAFCGGPDSGAGISNTAIPISSAALAKIAAVIEMGNPRYVYGLSYQVGTCRAQGFSARSAGYTCPSGNGRIQSYCDSADPYCCTGNDANVHQGYGSEYGQAALTFVKSKLSASSGGNGGSTGGGSTAAPTSAAPTSAAPTSAPTSGGGSGGNCSAKYGQCGGQGWTGPTCCASGSTCKASNSYYSQCL